jgi:hypothetical protein
MATKRMELRKPFWDYLREQRRVSIRFHHEWVSVGRSIIERREHRRKTRNVYEDYEGEADGQGNAGSAYHDNFTPVNIHDHYHRAMRPTLSLGSWRVNLRAAESGRAEVVERLEDNLNWEMDETDWDREVGFCDVNFLDYGRAAMRTYIGTPKTARVLADSGSAVYDPVTGKSMSLGEAIEDVGRAAAGRNGGDTKMEKHVLFGGRRYPRGSVFQRAITPEHVIPHYKADRIGDSSIIWQRHYLDERQATSLLSDFGSTVPVSKLPPYSLRQHVEKLDSELERRAGFQWALEEGVLDEKVYLFYEGWWRDEGLTVWECDGYDAKAIHTQKWAGPEGQYPWDFWDESNRTGRLNPLGVFAGMEEDADQVNVINSMAFAAARQAKTLIFIMKMLLDKDERKALQSGKPLSLILTKKKIDKDSILIQQLQQDLTQWFQIRQMALDSSRRGVGLTVERLSSTAQGSSPTESMLTNRTGELQESERMIGKRMFLKDCIRKRIAFKRHARPLWPDKGDPGQKLQQGAIGMKLDGSPYSIQKGFTEEDLTQPLKIEINVVKKNPVDALREYEQYKEWVRMMINFGAIDPWGSTEHAYDLLDIRNPKVMRPRQETPDAHEEHSLILKGIPVRIGEYEDTTRHLQRHNLFRSIVEALMQGGVPPEMKALVDPIHMAYVKDARNPNPETGETALDRLEQHIQSYGAGPAGAGGPSEKGLMQAATSPGSAPEGRAHARARVDRQSGTVPFGAQGKGGGGMG